jgi:hypothetical protein
MDARAAPDHQRNERFDQALGLGQFFDHGFS